jgi:hypothetical protein
MSSSNSIASLERTSLNVYEADIFNCSRQSVVLSEVEVALFCAILSAAKDLRRLRPFTSFRAAARRPSRATIFLVARFGRCARRERIRAQIRREILRHIRASARPAQDDRRRPDFP